jgi:hypothetical protein
VELKLPEQPTAERYVAGSLSAEEAARFEEWMVDRPDLAADVNVRRRIKAGLSVLEQRNELAPLLASAPQRPNYFRHAAAAAAVLVVASGIWVGWNREGVAPLQVMLSSNEIGSRPVAKSFMLARTRSTGDPVFTVQRDDGPVRLQILVEDPAAAPFSAFLFSTDASDGGRPFEKSTIARTTNGFAEIYLDPRALISGAYGLSLKSRAGTEQLFAFELRISH